MRTCPLVISLGLMFPVGAIADEPVQTVLFYIVGIGIDGSASAGPLTADIDVSMSEVFENLEMGAMGSYRWDSDPWAFQLDAIYASLGADQTGSRGIARATLDLNQIMIEGDVGYQLSENFELMVGARYWDFETEIELVGSGPLGIVRRSEGAESWVDPLIGLRVVAPISESWTFIARGDVGGFGVGSDFAWHASAFFDWRFSEQFSMLFGYRIFDFEFEERGDAGLFALDMQESGPGIGIAFSF
jgi:hypothetical protein